MERRFALIGAGAVGSHLAVALKESGQQIVQIISRGIQAGQSLANEVGAVFSERPEDLEDDLSHIILTLPDHAINKVLLELPKRNAIIIHTSGSFPMIGLDNWGSEYGVFYPLQSFTKNLIPSWDKIPLFVEASTKEIEKDLLNLANEISAKGIVIDSKNRMKLHVAAIYASNFTNYLLGKAQAMLSEIDLSDELIKPLVYETIRKSFELGATEAQTGPARRGDTDTIKMHLDLLSCCQKDRDLYKTLSGIIEDEYEK